MSVRWSWMMMAIAAFVVMAAPAPAAPADDWKAVWDRTVEAAGKEGALVISGPSGTAWREQLLTFQKAYPGIKVDITASASREFWPRVIKEREAGLHLWDFRIGGPDTFSYSVKTMGAMTPVRDMLILPEVTDDSAWLGGLDGIFLDTEKKYFLGFAIYEEGFGTYNSKLIPDVGGMKNLNDPKWTGKISIADPRAGSSLVGSGVIVKSYGDDFLRKLITVQKLTPVKEPRQQMDWMASGRYPITLGLPSIVFVEYAARGASVEEYKKIGGQLVWSQGVGGIQALKDAPHPNATKVFVNWLLTRDVQAQIMQAVKLNSRRKDLPPAAPEFAVDYAKFDEYVGGQTELMQPFQRRASEIYRELLK
jgi:iron(III) transport system substrate-binding protein